MNPYEITLIVRPDLDDEHIRAVVDELANRVVAADGEVIATYPWSPARRRLAFSIRDYGDGFYFTMTFQFDAQRLRELDSYLKLNDRVLRYLIVQATDSMIRQSQQRVQQQAAAAAAAAHPPHAATAPPASASGIPVPPPDPSIQTEPVVAPPAPAPGIPVPLPDPSVQAEPVVAPPGPAPEPVIAVTPAPVPSEVQE